MIRRRVVAWTAAPLIVPVVASVAFAAACEDGWCPGVLAASAGYLALFSASVLGLAAALSTRPIAGWRAGLAAWLVGLAALVGVIAGSQFYELDVMPGITASWTSAVLLVSAFVVARPRQKARMGLSGFEPESHGPEP
jgi:hypothetical protein